MADFRAIGAVTSTMRSLLEDRLEDMGAQVVVSSGTPRPDPPQGAALAAETPRVNLFLYRVAQHPTLANDDLAPRAHPAAYGDPPLSLTLQYLITAFGSAVTALPDGSEVTDERQAQEVLGNAMRVLHDVAMVSRGTVRRRPPVGAGILDPVLQDELECLKITPVPLSLDELSKLWTGLAVRLRLSTAYEVSLVRIESTRPRPRPGIVGEPPAAGPRVTVFTLGPLRVDRLAVLRPPDIREHMPPYARVGDVLVLHGQGFRSGQQVSLGGLLVAPAAITPTRMEVPVPDAQLPNGSPIPAEEQLQPGPLEVFVRSPVGGQWAGYTRSEPRMAMLVPRVTNAAVAGRNIAINGQRLIDPARESEAILDHTVVSSAAFSVATPTAVTVPVPEVFPLAAVSCRVSGPLPVQVNLPVGATLEIVCGGLPADVPVAAGTLSAIAAQIESGLRNAGANPADPDAGLRGARVGVAGDRLVLFSGGFAAMPTVSPGPTAAALGLVPGVAWVGFLSEVLEPFRRLTAAAPALRVAFGGTARNVQLANPPTTLEDAAAELQAALRAGGPPLVFTTASVAVVGRRLLVVPGRFTGAPPAIAIAGVAGTDLTTVMELRFRSTVAIRVRVNGTESIDPVTVSLP